jgi:hypothetical protein
LFEDDLLFDINRNLVLFVTVNSSLYCLF